MNRRGQALIESALSLPIMIMVVGCILASAYRGLLYYSADHLLHEALICTDDSTTPECQLELEKKLRLIVFPACKLKTNINRNHARAKGTVSVEFKKLHSALPSLEIRKEIDFPLRVWR